VTRHRLSARLPLCFTTERKVKIINYKLCQEFKSSGSCPHGLETLRMKKFLLLLIAVVGVPGVEPGYDTYFQTNNHYQNFINPKHST
jgi:hypothetical protein